MSLFDCMGCFPKLCTCGGAERQTTHPGPEVIELPLKTISEANARDHWSKKARRVKHHRGVARLLTQKAARATALPVVVTLTRIAPSNGLDDDNLRSALKAIRDGIADAYGLDDRDPSITWRYAQRRGATYAVQVEIERKGEPA